MLRDVGVRTKLLAVLAIPTVLLVVVTALLVGGQVSAARRAGPGERADRRRHPGQPRRAQPPGGAQRDPRLPAGHQRRRQGPDGGPAPVHQPAADAACATLVADSHVEQMSDAVRTAVGRSAAAHDELPSARRSVDAGRFFATEADVFYTKTIRTDLDLPERRRHLRHHRAGPAAAGLRGALQRHRVRRPRARPGRGRPAARHPDRGRLRPRRGPGRPAAPGACRTSSGTRPPTSSPGSTTPSPSPQVFEIDQVRRELPDLLKGQDPDIGGSVDLGRRRELADQPDDQRGVRPRRRHRDRRRRHPEQPGAAGAGAGRRLRCSASAWP